MSEIQQMFEKAVKGLLDQGCKSFDEERSICMYRGDNGAKCFIGHLIEDEFYYDYLENLPSGNDKIIKTLVDSGFSEFILRENIDFLSNCQRVHDEFEFKDYSNLYKKLGEEYELDTAFIDNYHSSK